MTLIYDIECYKNYFLLLLYSVEKDEYYTYELYNGKLSNNISSLKALIKDSFLVGYNSNNYDTHLLDLFLKGTSNQKLKQLSDCIINGEIKKRNNNKYSIDLMTLIFNKNGDSLKMMGCKLHHPKLEELPISPDKVITEEEVEVLRTYCKNDVEITHKLYLKLKDKLNLRWEMGKDYLNNHFALLSSNDSWVSDVIVKNTYSKMFGIEKSELNSLSTERKSVKLKDIILDNVSFSSEPLNEFLDYFKEIVYVPNSSKASDIKLLNYNGNVYQLGFGGIHGVHKAQYVESTSEYYISDLDVGSQYPSKIISENIINEKLDPRFISEWYKKLRDDRILDKKEKRKAKADSKKIILNSFFGKYGYKLTHFLKDHKALLKVTINNQLQLLMLIEAMELADFKCISCNTDGATFLVQYGREGIYAEIKSNWEKKVSLELEEEIYEKMIFRDVNNYIWYAKNGDIKKKGCFSTKQELEKGFLTRIVPLALEAYFTDGVLPEDFINAHTDIQDFLYCQKVAKTFDVYYGNTRVGNINRYYVSKYGEEITKRDFFKDRDRIISLVSNYLVTLLNDIGDNNIEYYNINYDYYIKETYKIIDTIMEVYVISVVTEIDSFFEILNFIKRTKNVALVTKEVEKLKVKYDTEFVACSKLDEIPNVKI